MHGNDIPGRQRDTQERIFRLAQRDHGLTLKAISLDSGIGYTTIQSYANGGSVMSIASLYALVGVIPDQLLSLLLPDGHQIVRADEGLDHDKIEDLCRDFVATKAKAHHVDSPAGRDLSSCEIEALNVAYLPLRGAVA